MGKKLIGRSLARKEIRMTEKKEKDIKKEEKNIKDGEYCGVEKFNGKKFNTCTGEEIVEEGYKNPDK